MAFRFSLLFSIAFIRFTSAWIADPTRDQWCTYGCDQACDYNVFAGTPNSSDGYYLAGCQNALQVSSFWACNRKYCTEAEIDAGTVWKSAYCQFYAGADVLPISIISNLTEGDINALPILEFGSVDTVNVTSLVDQQTFDLAYRTGAEYYQQEIYHQTYAEVMFIYWGILVGLGILYNGFHRFGPAIKAPVWMIKARNFLITRPFTALQGDGSRPALLESLVNTSFLILNIILVAVNYTAFDGNIFWPSTSEQTWRYLADRTGYLAYANLVIFWLFGVRNNLLIQATGWPFATFSRFHRAVAFLSTVEAIIHSISYSAFSYVSGGNEAYLENFAEQYWNVGVVATVTMSFAVVFSITWFRVRWYDLFLVTHILLALVTLVMLFYHTGIFSGRYDGYLWPCVAFWALDRLIRFARVSWNYLTAHSASCLVEYDRDADVVRIDVTKALSRLGRDVNGAHYYMYLLKSLRCWESHPFTLVRWRDAASRSDTKTANLWRYSFIIRPYDGFTRTLASRSLQGPVTKLCLYEGPYSSSPSLHKHSGDSHGITRLVYIIGGSGISVAISSIYRVLHGNSDIKIKLVWAVRRHAFLTSVLDRELRAVKHQIRVAAYITREAAVDQKVEDFEGINFPKSIAESNSDSGQDNTAGVSVSNGRPDVLRAIVDAVSNSSGIVGIVTCGPVRMMSDVRRGVVQANIDGIERARSFAQDFAW